MYHPYYFLSNIRLKHKQLVIAFQKSYPDSPILRRGVINLPDTLAPGNKNSYCSDIINSFVLTYKVNPLSSQVIFPETLLIISRALKSGNFSRSDNYPT